ncbi:MAG: hypothetical protein FWH37_00825 [Candidatus Bathyarchaeota archaeon]|nr:hypothetical protein [Candidatus Termiticorpusculum sp.]
MEVKIGFDPDLMVRFDEGKLKGMTIKFWGDRLVDKTVFGLRSGRVVMPVEGKKLPVEIRKLTDEEREYVKSAVLAYVKAGNEDGTIKRKVEFIDR